MSIKSKIICEQKEICDFLRKNKMLRDENILTFEERNGRLINITWSTKNDTATVLFDSNSIKETVEQLLTNRQYNILLYDKSILSAEYIVKNNIIVQQRLIFLKSNNIKWDHSEIDNFDLFDNWEEFPSDMPILFRVDYNMNFSSPSHSKAHMTINNIIDCRIPLKSNISFSKFSSFVLKNVYGINMSVNSNIEFECSICNDDKNQIILDYFE